LVTAAAVLAGLTACSVGDIGPGAWTVTRKEPIIRPVGVSGDGRVLAVTVESGGCDDPPGLKVSETADNVSLTVRITTRTGPDAICPAVARVDLVRAVLRTALGARTVTDATSGHRLSPRRDDGLPCLVRRGPERGTKRTTSFCPHALRK
jgi:hypothetical protein